MFVAMKRVGAANSEGVLSSGPFSLAKGFIKCVIQRIGTSRSSGAKPHCAVAGYKHCIPTGLFKRSAQSSQETRVLRCATQRFCAKSQWRAFSIAAAISSIICRSVIAIQP